jgi:hypothetical protein
MGKALTQEQYALLTTIAAAGDEGYALSLPQVVPSIALNYLGLIDEITFDRGKLKLGRWRVTDAGRRVLQSVGRVLQCMCDNCEEQLTAVYVNVTDLAGVLLDRAALCEDCAEALASVSIFGARARGDDPAIKTITRAYVRTYSDSGQITAYVEFVATDGSGSRIEGEPGDPRMAALFGRARREGIKVERETF